MSDPTRPDDPGPGEQDELLAAEYVLGTLPEDERRAARDRIEVDGAFAARVRAWELRLAPLNADYAEASAPDLLPAIEERLFGGAAPARAARPVPRRRWFDLGWRGGALAAAAAAVIVFLAVALWPPSPAPVVLRADLAAEDADLRFAARWDAAAGRLELTRVSGTAAPEGQDYELWLIDEAGVPRSLGLLRDPVTQVAAVLAPGLTLAVSLEPEGGSPEPVPTGPVLAAAALAEG
jgi:anti-sigma-K factor RskA